MPAPSFTVGMVISMAVSHRSRTSSTILGIGLRTAKDRARWCPNPEEGRSRDLLGGEAGDERPEDSPDGGEVRVPIWRPLYSGRGGVGTDSVEVEREFLFCDSSASRTLTIDWRCSARLSWANC